MNLNPLVLAANVQEMSPNKALPKVVSRYNASEFKIVDKLVIGPSPQKGKGLYSLKGIESGEVVTKYGEPLGDYYSPNSSPTLPIFGDTAQKILESLGVPLSVYGLYIPPLNKSNCFIQMHRNIRNNVKGSGINIPSVNDFEKRFCSAEFIHYLNELVFFNKDWIGQPKKPKFLDEPFYAMVNVLELATSAFGYDLMPLSRDGNRKMVCPGLLPAAYVNTANSSKESNCEFHDCGGVPGLVATRKIEPGDGIEAKTYGDSYKMNPNVSIDSTLKSLEEWLSKKPYGKEGYILAVKSFELFTKTFSLDAERRKR